MQYSDALTLMKKTNNTIEMIDKALKTKHKELKEFLCVIEDRLLLKLNRNAEFLESFLKHSKDFNQCKELYEVRFVVCNVIYIALF